MLIESDFDSDLNYKIILEIILLESDFDSDFDANLTNVNWLSLLSLI